MWAAVRFRRYGSGQLFLGQSMGIYTKNKFQLQNYQH